MTQRKNAKIIVKTASQSEEADDPGRKTPEIADHRKKRDKRTVIYRKKTDDQY